MIIRKAMYGCGLYFFIKLAYNSPILCKFAMVDHSMTPVALGTADNELWITANNDVSSIKEYFKSNITSPIRRTNTVYVKNSPHKFVRRCKYRLMIFLILNFLFEF